MTSPLAQSLERMVDSCGPLNRRIRGQTTDWLRARRALLGSALWLIALGVVPITGRAHGGVGHADGTVALWLVLSVPVAVGLFAGFATIQRSRSRGDGRFGVILSGILLALGANLAFTAMTTEFWVAIWGLGAGAITTSTVVLRWRESTGHRHIHGDIACGGLLTHRLIEGVLVGGLYIAGAALGLLATVALVAHTSLEASALGGLYGSERRRGQLAVVLAQGGYLVGAGIGIGVGGTVPDSIQVLALGMGGGVLLVVGGREIHGQVGWPRLTSTNA